MKPTLYIIADRMYRNPRGLKPAGWNLVINKDTAYSGYRENDLAIVMDNDPTERLEEFYDTTDKRFTLGNVFYIKTNDSGFPCDHVRQKFITAWNAKLMLLGEALPQDEAQTRITRDFDLHDWKMRDAVKDLIWWNGLSRKYKVACDLTPSKHTYPNWLIDSKQRELWYVFTLYKGLTYLQAAIFRYPDTVNFDMLMIDPRYTLKALSKHKPDWKYFGADTPSLEHPLFIRNTP